MKKNKKQKKCYFCKAKASAKINCKDACQLHFDIIKRENKYKRNKKSIKKNYNICSIPGCNNRLSHTNTTGICIHHKLIKC